MVVLRLKEESLKSLLPGAIVFARQKIGTEYSTTEARLAKLENDLKAKETNRQFCTRFVAQAYEQAGIKIVDKPDYCTPQEILESPSLQIIPDTTRTAIDKEIQFATDEYNPLEVQREIHNYIFEESRKISKCDIQTFEQLSKYVLEHPDKESQITEVLKKSGYLEMWQNDVKRNPWHYDYKEFLKHYTNPQQRKEAGYFWATTERKTRERFYKTLETLEFGLSFYRQDFFKLQIDLYKKLIELSEKREFVGSKS